MSEAFETICYFLSWHGLWPDAGSNSFGFGDFLYVSLKFSVIYVLGLLCCMHLFMSWKDNSEQLQADDFLFMVELFFFSYIFNMYFWQINDLIRLIGDVRNYDEFGKPDTLGELVRKQNKYTKIIYIYTSIGILIYAFASFSNMRQCEKFRKSTQFCYFMFPIWMPFDVSDTPYFRYIMVVLEMIAALSSLLSSILGNYLSASITEHITIRVQHLRLLVRQVDMIASEEDKIIQLIHCIKYHVNIIRLSDKTSEIFAKMNASHSITPIIIGVLNFKIIMIFSIKDIMQVLGWVFSIGILCFNGQELINESQALADDVYDLKWYSLYPRYRYYIIMVIMRTQTPPRIAAGIFYSYSHEFMMMIMQASYSYTTILRQLLMRSTN